MGTSLAARAQRPPASAVLFICDGLPAQLVEEGCREGWLPNINRYLMQGGVHVRHAVGCVPTITYPTITTFLTGAAPERHQIIDNRWFDRRERLFRDYGYVDTYRLVNEDFTVPTVYERLGPAASASIQNAITRGVTWNFPNWMYSGTCWFFGNYTAVDKMTASTVEEVASWANLHDRWPTFLTCYFPAVDAVGHHQGYDTPAHRRAIKHIDHQIGRICGWLETQGLLKTTYIALVSDHGQIPIRSDGHIDSMDYVRRKWGRKATDCTTLQLAPRAQRQQYFDQFDTVVVHDGPRVVTLHFAGPAGWDTPPPPDMVQQILETPAPADRLWEVRGIDLIAYLASEQETVLRAARGIARIQERDGPQGREFRYVPEPDDVLGYMSDSKLAAFVTAGFHSSRDWLRATTSQTYPDLVPHLGPLLRTPRSGQVLVFAAHDYGFGDELAGHGGIHRDEVFIPMYFAGPGLPAGETIDVARAADVTPTLLRLLGVPTPSDGWLDGVPLFPDVKPVTPGFDQ